MAGDAPTFLTNLIGIEQGRTPPVGWEPPDGDYALVSGSDLAGRFQRFNVGDKIEWNQSDDLSVSKILRLLSRARGPSRMPALTAVENFVLADGYTLQIRFDKQRGGSIQTVTFSTGQFAAIGAARAIEVRDAINSQITGGEANLTGTGEVSIHSDREGRGSRVEIVGGTAVAALGVAELAWQATISIAGNPFAQFQLRPGETVDYTDIAANLAGLGVSNFLFALELVQV